MPTKCYYELLGVERDANDDDIKKAYRKQALVWHPDKNPDRAKEATEMFRAIQLAYDVLSDSQERRWYDDHREAIIRGGFKHRGADGTPEDEEDDGLDVYEYFTTSCFTGFDDEEEGFFKVYGRVFRQISEEDMPFLDVDEQVMAPDFGLSGSDFEDIVGPFYEYWESYSTAKTYCWVDKWDTREAPNRDYRRLMEAENKKVRDKARKERNDEVRALVRFVKKRDPRVAAHRIEERNLMEQKNAAAAKKQEEMRRQQAIARREILEAAEREAEEGKAEWAQADDDRLREVEEHLASDFGKNSISEGAEEVDELYCVACDKSFKTEKALLNHVKSRKHTERVEFVRQELSGMSEDDESVQQILKEIEAMESKVSSMDTAEEDRQSKRSKKKQLRKGNYSDSDDEAELIGENETDSPTAVPSASSASQTTPNKVTSSAVADEPQKRPKVKTRQPKVVQQPEEVVYQCVKCKEVFPTRNKLFQHLSTTGHAQAPKVVMAPPGSGKRGKAGKAKQT